MNPLVIGGSRWTNKPVRPTLYRQRKVFNKPPRVVNLSHGVKDFPREPAEGGVLCGKESAHAVGLCYRNRTRQRKPSDVPADGFGSKRRLGARCCLRTRASRCG